MDQRPCAAFLQWALPRLRLAPDGFRRVRGQVCKRVRRRMQAIGVGGWDMYQRYLEAHHEEWDELAVMCRISVSRFYRDAEVFDALRERVLPPLADGAAARGNDTLVVWSAGCASGEEPYTLALLWRFAIAQRHPDLRLRVLATDADAAAIDRARTGCYPPSSVKELPRDWLTAFEKRDGRLCLGTALRALVEFRVHDLGEQPPAGPFDLVLCRNLVFTYFAEPLRTEVARRLLATLVPGGALLAGAREPVDHGALCLDPLAGVPGLFRRQA
jgi:chemotaxis protein methyltransferase CheR